MDSRQLPHRTAQPVTVDDKGFRYMLHIDQCHAHSSRSGQRSQHAALCPVPVV